MERRIEEYECAESVLLLKTFNGIRQTLMARELEEDKKKLESMGAQAKPKQDKSKIKTAGAPPVLLV